MIEKKLKSVLKKFWVKKKFMHYLSCADYMNPMMDIEIYASPIPHTHITMNQGLGGAHISM